MWLALSIRVEKKEKEKFEYYIDLKYELLKDWNTEVTKVYIIPNVTGALGIVTKNIVKYLEKIDFKPGLEPLQKACLLGTARIIRKVLDYEQSDYVLERKTCNLLSQATG